MTEPVMLIGNRVRVVGPPPSVEDLARLEPWAAEAAVHHYTSGDEGDWTSGEVADAAIAKAGCYSLTWNGHERVLIFMSEQERVGLEDLP